MESSHKRGRSAGKAKSSRPAKAGSQFRAGGGVRTYTTGGQRPMGGFKTYGRGQQAELKLLDTDLELSPVIATTNSNAGMFSLNLVQQGSGSFNRIGKRINMKSVRIRGVVYHTYGLEVVTENIRGNVLRMVVVYDRSPQNTEPTFNTVFGRVSQDGTQSAAQFDALDPFHTDRFRVLRDIIVPFSPGANPATDVGTGNLCVNSAFVDEYIKLDGLDTVYSGTTDPLTITDVNTGGLYVYFRAETNGSADYCTVDSSVSARLRYWD